MTVTLKDIAERVGKSITTVSRALYDYDDVSPKTKELVHKAALEMGYTPNTFAQRLQKQRTDTLGFIIPTFGPRFSDPFFSEFIAGLGDEVALHHFDLLVSTAPPGGPEEQALYQRWVQSRRIDGLVLSRMRLQDWRVEYLGNAGSPFVALGRSHTLVDYPYIEVDSRAGFATLVRHLVERGHRRIAYIGALADLVLQSERLAGYRDGLSAAGLAFDETLVAEGNLTRVGGYRAAQRLLDLPDPPTAIIGVNDLTAIGAIRAAHERKLVVGRDLAVAGYDGIEDAEHTHPPLTTLNQPVYDLARRLVPMLLAQIDGEPLPERHVLLQPELVARESTGG